jgi:hypothetical protein
MMREGESEKQVLHALEDNIIVLNDARLVTGFPSFCFLFLVLPCCITT